MVLSLAARLSSRTLLSSSSLSLSLTSLRASCSSKYSHRLASTLVVSEPLQNGNIPAATCSAVTAAHQLVKDGESLGLLVVTGNSDATIPSQVPKGVTHIMLAQATTAPDVTAVTSETVALAIQQAVKDDSYAIVLGTSTKFGATVIPRASALLQASPITDIIDIQSEGVYDFYTTCICRIYNILCIHRYSHFRSVFFYIKKISLVLTIRHLCSSHVRG